ncbi:MAG: hypothetical protein WCV90_06400 [Candidatus Woesearchaeota archaeon]|jgi:hypothetical protein
MTDLRGKVREVVIGKSGGELVARLNDGQEVVLLRAPHGHYFGSVLSEPQLCGDIVRYTRTDHISARGDYGSISRDEVMSCTVDLRGTALIENEGDNHKYDSVNRSCPRTPTRSFSW